MRWPPRRAARDGSQRGAILVEFVIVVPLFMILVLGIFEIGTAWESRQTVVQASRGGARTAAQLGTLDATDQQVVLAMASTFGPDVGDIIKIVVFEADGNGDWLGPSCATATPVASDRCNVYDQTDIAARATASYFDDAAVEGDCGTGASALWCPSARNASQTSATYVGVYVEFDEQYQTGFFGSGTYTLSARTVMRIEPESS